MYSCPNCGDQHIMIIDIAEPPQVFECVKCNTRFHRFGFTPSEVDVNVSTGASERLTLSNLLHK